MKAPRSFRSKFRTYRIWFYLLFGFSFFAFATASAFATNVYTLTTSKGTVSGTNPDDVTSQMWYMTYPTCTGSGPTSITHAITGNQSWSGTVNWNNPCNSNPNDGAGFMGTFSDVTCPSGQVIDHNGQCAVPAPVPDGSTCDPSQGSATSNPQQVCMPSGQICETLLSVNIGGSPGVYSYSSNIYGGGGSCTFDPATQNFPPKVPPVPLDPPLDPTACGPAMVSVGSSCYPTTGAQCGSVNGVTVCTGGAQPTPGTKVENDSSGNAVKSTIPPPPPAYSGNVTDPGTHQPNPIDVYNGFTQGGGDIPTTPADGSGNCPPGYGKISNGVTTVCIKDGSSGDGSGVGDKSGGSGNNGPSSTCGGTGQPPCGQSSCGGPGQPKCQIDFGKQSDFTAPDIPTTPDVNTSASDYFSTLENAPIVQALGAISASFPSGGSCSPFVLDFSFFGHAAHLSTDIICTTWTSISGAFSVITLAVWTIAAVVIVLTA